MSDIDDTNVLNQPRVYMIRMVVFTLLVVIIGSILYTQLARAFFANPGLNGTIMVALILGVLYAFRQVWRLFPEVNWVNNFRIADPGLEIPYTPKLLAPMAALLADRQGETVLTTVSMRSLLDSMASRLDEARDISRYLIGLLVFLGLLGTFWGLLQTINAIGLSINSLDITSSESSTIFEELKSGLKAPLAGMGTSFSSSLFGLAGSLILGFLDLQASQAQNRFYNDLEDWLSSITDIEAGDVAGVGVPQYLRMDLSSLQEGIEQINHTLEEALSEPAPGAAATESHDTESLEKLASAVQGLVHQMREEQKIVRQWAQAQSDQQSEIRRLLTGAEGGAKGAASGSRLGAAIKAPRRTES